MFEIKETFRVDAIVVSLEALASDLHSPLAKVCQDELMPMVADYIKAANAEIKRLQEFEPAPEKPKRYEIKEKYESADIKHYRIYDNSYKIQVANLLSSTEAEYICEKLNRLEELEAKE